MPCKKKLKKKKPFRVFHDSRKIGMLSEIQTFMHSPPKPEWRACLKRTDLGITHLSSQIGNLSQCWQISSANPVAGAMWQLRCLGWTSANGPIRHWPIIPMGEELESLFHSSTDTFHSEVKPAISITFSKSYSLFYLIYSPITVL